LELARRAGLVPALTWMALAYLLLPAFVVFPLSVTDTRYLALPQHGISLSHWATFLSSSAWLGSVGQSFIIAVASTTIAVLCGTLCAIGCWKMTSHWAQVVRGLMLAPLIVPTIVYALALYRFYVDLRLLDTYIGIIIAHAVTGLPYVVITVTAAISNFDLRLEQASRNLGASTAQTLRMVIIPNLAPGIVSGAIFAFVHSWDELIIVLFVASRRVVTLPRMIWSGINESLDPVIAVVAAILICFTLLLLVPIVRLRDNN
jgi:putative spermidine/putrescine transport system permease protein